MITVLFASFAWAAVPPSGLIKTVGANELNLSHHYYWQGLIPKVESSQSAGQDDFSFFISVLIGLILVTAFLWGRATRFDDFWLSRIFSVLSFFPAVIVGIMALSVMNNFGVIEIVELVALVNFAFLAFEALSSPRHRVFGGRDGLRVGLAGVSLLIFTAIISYQMGTITGSLIAGAIIFFLAAAAGSIGRFVAKDC